MPWRGAEAKHACRNVTIGTLLDGQADVSAGLGERIDRLLALAYFDTAVREACVTLESRLKLWLSSDRWGDRLVEDFFGQMASRKLLLNTQLKTLRGEVRAVFKFIRNDFMHNFVNIDQTQCRAILFRIQRVNTFISDIIERTSGVQDA